MKIYDITRRQMLKSTAISGVVLSAPTIIPVTVLGRNNVAPSDRVNIGAIACGGRANYTDEYQDYAKSQVVAVCDPVKERRLVKKKKYGNCADYNDFRDVLARSDIDAVHIATPDHWHVPISLAAAQAGKDMYTEKPLGLSIKQCLAAREIVDKHKRVFQYGTQNRSLVQVRMGLELIFMDTCTANSTQRKDRIPHMADIQFNHGTLFEGTTGWVAVTRAGWKVYPESLYKKAKNPGQIRLKESKHHARHFVDCVLSRKQPISNLHSAVRSDMICHLSDICIRTGREIEWDPKKETIVNDPDAQQRMHRDMRLPWTL